MSQRRIGATSKMKGDLNFAHDSVHGHYGIQATIQDGADGEVCVCDICGKAYTKKRNMLRHRRTHTGEMKHSCPVCWKYFYRVDVLKEHVKSTHKLKSGQD